MIEKKPDTPRTSVLIVAAGRGRRFGEGTPKQYVPIAGVCALRRTLDRFLSVERIDVVQVVVHPDDATRYAEAVLGLEEARLLPSVSGGEARVQSVLRGLDALAPHAPDNVLVHDAARPFVPLRVIEDVLDRLLTHVAAFAALPVVDALWQVADGEAQVPVPRAGLWRAQTPQGFNFETLRTAHAAYTGDAADDVEIARAMGVAVQVVRGDPDNFKITTPEDRSRAERLIRQMA